MLHKPHGILIPWPGMEPVRPGVEAWSLNCWTAMEVSNFYINFKISFLNSTPKNCAENTEGADSEDQYKVGELPSL